MSASAVLALGVGVAIGAWISTICNWVCDRIEARHDNEWYYYQTPKKSLEDRVKTYTELGEIILKEAGEEACKEGYDTTDPDRVGRLAIAFGDIDRDGTLN